MNISERDFSRILRHVQTDTGIDLPDASYRQFKRFLSERCILLKTDPISYVESVRNDPGEYDRFIDALTINETYFFREEKQFGVLEEVVFGAFIKSGKQLLKFWSASCSTGEEAVSIAALAEKCLDTENTGYRVFAGDLNPRSLEAFAKGEYTRNSFRQDGSKFHGLLEPFMTGDKNKKKLTESLKRKIEISKLNLFKDDLSILPSDFDLVFFRNTMIYMASEIREEMLEKIVSKMAPEGCLFLSSTEIPIVSHRELKLMNHGGVYFFRKKTIDEKKMGRPRDRRLELEIDEKPAPPKSEEFETVDVCVDEILNYANQKMNNRLFSVENDLNYDLALKFIDVVFKINADRVHDAEKILIAIESAASPTEISTYLRGYIHMVNMKTDAAIRLFNKTLELSTKFWPARFYLGLLLMKYSKRESKKAFAACLKSIDAYLAENSFRYHFLLEGFNAKYFRNMCKRWVEKL